MMPDRSQPSRASLAPTGGRWCCGLTEPVLVSTVIGGIACIPLYPDTPLDTVPAQHRATCRTQARYKPALNCGRPVLAPCNRGGRNQSRSSQQAAVRSCHCSAPDAVKGTTMTTLVPQPNLQRHAGQSPARRSLHQRHHRPEPADARPPGRRRHPDHRHAAGLLGADDHAGLRGWP
jgi:hypothetical protein